MKYLFRISFVICLCLRASGALLAEEDGDAIQERARFYLERHGDHGRIDPERRLKAVAREYARRKAEQRGTAPLAVGGSTWTSIGPTNGAGRMTAIAPHPSASGTLYAGAADGGVWKTTNGGTTWSPLTDLISDLSVGAVALAPGTPDTVYVGTGEAGFGADFIPGIGLLTSTNGGADWILPASVVASSFYRIDVNPSNASDLVIGTDVGGLRSTNGGTSWKTVIDPAVYGHVTDIVRDPTDPTVLYAGNWSATASATAASKVLKSTNSGDTWTEKSAGLPTSPARDGSQRMALAISASSHLVLYAAFGLYDGVSATVSHIYKTTNGGDNWGELTALSGSANYGVSHYLGEQAFYDNTIVVSPTNANVVVAGGIGHVRSVDGGASFTNAGNGGAYIHVDAHDLRYQGTNLYAANDGGLNVSVDDGNAFYPLNDGLVTRQFYSLGIDPVNRDRAIGGTQDNGTNQRTGAGGALWRVVVGADGFEGGINGLVPSFAYGSQQRGALYRTKDAGASDVDVRFGSIGPRYPSPETGAFYTLLTFDPSTPSTLYTGSYRLWRSVNAGDSWQPMPITTTDASAWNGAYISAIAVARSNPSILLVSKSSQAYRSTNGGTSWVMASGGLPAVAINNVEVDPVNPLIAYAALATTTGPSVYRTLDGGASWTARSSGLPAFTAQVVRVDPTDSNVLYCGTDVGVYRSLDQGGSWSLFGTGLPASSAQDLRILEDASMLRVATHGRGVWELQVPPTGNTPPTAQITLPAGPQRVAKGTPVSFNGNVSDPDGGDSLTVKWVFPDTWQTAPGSSGATSGSHTFQTAGVFPVTLAARDSHGARGASTVVISVPEAADACATPLVIPGAGPFPYSVGLNSESGTSEGTDPNPPSCSPYGSYLLNASLWLEFTPASTTTYEVCAQGTGFSHIVSAYTGAACGPYSPVGCSASAAGSGPCSGTGATQLLVAGTSGQTLRILVFDYTPDIAETFAVTVRPTGGPAGAPRVTGVSQATAPTTGNTALTLTGAGFVSGATVAFGGTAATNVSVPEAGFLYATAPAHAAGPVAITVTNPDQTSGTLTNAFTYVPPGLHGDVNGDSTITVADVFYLINYLFANGAAPIGIADVNNDNAVTVGDVFYLINYLFANGPAPL